MLLNIKYTGRLYTRESWHCLPFFGQLPFEDTINTQEGDFAGLHDDPDEL